MKKNVNNKIKNGNQKIANTSTLWAIFSRHTNELMDECGDLMVFKSRELARQMNRLTPLFGRVVKLEIRTA